MKKIQQGMSLIELMISLTLSLSLIAGLSTLFTQIQKTNKSQQAISGIMDDSRYALEILQKEMRYTGGLRNGSDVNGDNAHIFLGLAGTGLLGAGSNPAVATDPYGFLGGEYIRGDKTASTNDAFMIRYQLVEQKDLNSVPGNTNSSSPCTGNSLLDNETNAANNPATNVHVVTVSFRVTSGQLVCTSQRVLVNPLATPPTITCLTNCPLDAQPTSPVVLIENVDKFIATYGVDTDNNNAANYYVKANAVPSGMWPNVISMRIYMVLKSQDTHLTSAPVSYNIDGVAANPTPTDNAIYRVFSTTIAFRNQLGR